MEALLIGVAAAFNFLVVKWKIEHSRFADAGLDVIILIILSFIFGGTMGGMIVATIASFIVSFALLASPPNLSFIERMFKDEIEEFKRDIAK